MLCSYSTLPGRAQIQGMREPRSPDPRELPGLWEPSVPDWGFFVSQERGGTIFATAVQVSISQSMFLAGFRLPLCADPPSPLWHILKWRN